MPQLLHDRPGATEPTATNTAPDAPTGATPTRVVVEGATAEAALEAVHREHGTGARIIQAEKVLRGGVGGFFAKELVQLTVEPAAPASTATPDAGGNAIAQALADAAGDDDGPPGETFGEMLDRRAAARGEATSGASSVRGTPLAASSLSAAPSSAPQPAPQPTPQPEMSAQPAMSRGLAGVVADLAAATDHRESTFGDALRAAMTGDDAEHAPGTASLVEGTVGAGATALAVAAPAVTSERTAAPAAPMAHAEQRLDAAIRAVSAGTTAATVVRAAESGGITGYAHPDLGREAAAQDSTPDLLQDVIASATAAVESVAPAPVSPVEEPVAPSTTTPAGAWSMDALRRLGMPEGVLAAVSVQRPSDDLGWFAAVTRALQPLCGALPEGHDVVVGGFARRYAKAALTTVVTLDDKAPRRGSVAVAARVSDRTRSWMDRESRGRWLHLVVGGVGWRDWLFERPSVVSWTCDEDLPAAITAAAQLDLTLGHGIVDGVPTRASAVDLAITLRAMLDGR